MVVSEFQRDTLTAGALTHQMSILLEGGLDYGSGPSYDDYEYEYYAASYPAPTGMVVILGSPS
jgi:hypothetical protein